MMVKVVVARAPPSVVSKVYGPDVWITKQSQSALLDSVHITIAVRH